MATARLHDGAGLGVTTAGEGPAILLPISTAVIDGELADQMRAWGAEPNNGHDLLTGLAEAGFRVIAADTTPGMATASIVCRISALTARIASRSSGRARDSRSS